MEKGLQRNAERTCRRLPHASLCSPLLEQIFRLIQLFMCVCMVCACVCAVSLGDVHHLYYRQRTHLRLESAGRT